MGNYTRERLQRIAGILDGVSASPDIPQPLTEVLLCALEMLDELLDNEVKSVARDNTTKTF